MAVPLNSYMLAQTYRNRDIYSLFFSITSHEIFPCVLQIDLYIISTPNPTASCNRMKLCYLLPKVKSTLKVPTDKHLLQQLELCVRKLLCEEKDKDVLSIVKKVGGAVSTFCSLISNNSGIWLPEYFAWSWDKETNGKDFRKAIIFRYNGVAVHLILLCRLPGTLLERIVAMPVFKILSSTWYTDKVSETRTI